VCCAESPEGHGSDLLSPCESLEQCGWHGFFSEADGDESVRLGDRGLWLGGDGEGEVGVFAGETMSMAGELTVSFRALLNGAHCVVDDCRQALGVVLSAQTAPSAGTGVDPLVGIILDGEQQGVHYYVNGPRIEHSPTHTLADFTGPHRFVFRVTERGKVRFWVFRDAEHTTQQIVMTEPDYESVGHVDVAGPVVRLVLFGRLQGDEAARFDELTVDRSLCDIPGHWSESAPGRVLSLPARSYVRSPSVVVGPDGGLIMAYENNGHLEVAQSDGRGKEWDVVGTVLTGRSATEYGRVARRSPALLHWPDSPDGAAFHMWYVGEAELSAPQLVGTPTAIVHATSVDGLTWFDDREVPVAIEAAPEDSSRPLFAVVDGPNVFVRNEVLHMWFVGRDPATGRSNIFSATSADGRIWNRRDDPLFDPSDLEAFARDGVGEPTGFWRDGAFHMWFAGHSGATRAIGYALSATGHGWEHEGAVLLSSEPWHDGNIGAPAVLVMSADGAGLGQEVPTHDADWLRLWYEAGPAGREAVGLAWRWLP
jgi:hypothetical protein